jgi:trehalose/maltose transport system substrate-binding protein
MGDFARRAIEGAVTRPSTAAGPQYDRLSTAYFTAVRQTLIGEKSADAAVTELESELHRLSAK